MTGCYTSCFDRLQRDYDTAEEECQKYKMMYESAKQEVSVSVCVVQFSVVPVMCCQPF